MVVYKITNKINKKVYIGITTKTVEERWKQHVLTAHNKSSKDYKALFKKAIRKYGEENFQLEVLEEANDLETLKEREIYYIDKYNSFAFSENSNGYNSTRGGDYTDERIYKPVVKCDIVSGDIIKIYKTSSEAIKENGRIENAIEKENHTANGFCFLRKETVDRLTDQERVEYIHSLFPKLVYQLSLTGEVIAVYRDAGEASRAIGAKNIRDCCCGNGRKTAKGFQWVYQKDLKDRIGKAPVLRTRRVAQLSLSGEILKIWNNIAEASKELKIQDSHISSCCNKKRNSAGGFKWKLIDKNH